jgi:hypothetical protein
MGRKKLVSCKDKTIRHDYSVFRLFKLVSRTTSLNRDFHTHLHGVSHSISGDSDEYFQYFFKWLLGRNPTECADLVEAFMSSVCLRSTSGEPRPFRMVSMARLAKHLRGIYHSTKLAIATDAQGLQSANRHAEVKDAINTLEASDWVRICKDTLGDLNTHAAHTTLGNTDTKINTSAQNLATGVRLAGRQGRDERVLTTADMCRLSTGLLKRAREMLTCAAALYFQSSNVSWRWIVQGE